VVFDWIISLIWKQGTQIRTIKKCMFPETTCLGCLSIFLISYNVKLATTQTEPNEKLSYVNVARAMWRVQQLWISNYQLEKLSKSLTSERR
jgi:hypothetical protein